MSSKMKESLKWIILYNNRFPNNHPKLFTECKRLESEGRLEMHRYKDYFKNKGQLLDVVENLEHPEDIITLENKGIFKEYGTSEAYRRILKAPKKHLTSVTSLWYYEPWHMYTRIDLGEPELKYLINSERRLPKWKVNQE